MRITRLHILLGLIGLALVGYGLFAWMQRRTEQVPMKVPPHTPVVTKPIPRVPSPVPQAGPAVHPVVSAPSGNKESVARTLATIGEAYRRLPKPSGEIPAIAHSLRAAKDYLASGQLHLAMVCAREAWTALKKYEKMPAPIGESYEVVKGDTLWRIARDRSPVHQGPGWVTIWKANKRVVKDFNRIEVGWNLAIPGKPSQYIEPYWRPRQLTITKTPPFGKGRPGGISKLQNPPSSPFAKGGKSLVVDLPQVLAWAAQQRKKTPAGTSLYAYLAAQGNSLPLLGEGRGRGNRYAMANRQVPSPGLRPPSPEKGEGVRLARAPETVSFRQAGLSMTPRPFLESPQYQ